MLAALLGIDQPTTDLIPAAQVSGFDLETYRDRWKRYAQEIENLEERSCNSFPFSTSSYAGQWREWARHQGEELLSIETAWQAVQLISGDLAKLPVMKMLRTEDEAGNILERPQPSHPTWPMVHDRPTRNMGAFKFWRRFWVQALIWSNAYARINRDSMGRPVSFTLLESMMVSHSVGAFEDEGYFYITQNAEWVFIPADDMVHVEDLAVHRQSTVGGRVRNRPMWLIESALRQIGIDLAIDNYSEAFFKSGGRAGGWLELPATMRQKSRDTVEKGFRDVYENVTAAFKTIVARGGVKFHSSTINPNDTQMNESRQEAVKRWARRFNLPPHKLGDDSRTSYNSLEQENKAYYDSSLAPRARALTDELYTKLLMPFERSSGRHFYKHDRSEMTEADLETRSETAVKLHTNGLATQNEARRLVQLNPVEGGDDFMMPLNMARGADGNSEADIAQLRSAIDTYGIAVRAGALTPQPTDEDEFRNRLGLPAATDDARELWESQGNVRQPITLREDNDSPQRQPPQLASREGDDVPDEQEERAALVRGPLLHSLQHFLESTNDLASRKAAAMDPGVFAEWIKEPSNFNRPVFDKMVRTSAEAFAKATGRNTDELLDLLFSAMCHELRTKIQDNAPLIPQNRAMCLLERIENAGS